jgi:hypothetical protein
MRRALAAVSTATLVASACTRSPAAVEQRTGADSAAPSAPASTEPVAAPPPPHGDAPGNEAVEAGGFSVECANDSAAVAPRACIVRGTIRAVRAVEVASRSPGSTIGAGAPLRALAIEIAPDDAVPCRTPFDADAKELRMIEADFADVARARSILVLGGARVAKALAEGRPLCGWARNAEPPGLHGRGERHWEGELADGSGALLGAGSFYFDASRSKMLARAWRFSRFGPAERRPLSEGGAFVRHHAVRIAHGAASVVSIDGAEVVLQGRDGAFAVRATSDLTEGDVPPFVGRHDGFAFSAIRISAADGGVELTTPLR